jgi:meso-butanediol dehydrogenase / (S,S)-butanediol dehydrogenase / diacetyl reductase
VEDEMEFAERVVLITGAASGIGRAAAEAFGALRARVVVVDRNGNQAAAVAERICACEGSAIGVEADVSLSAEVDRAVTEAEDTFGAVGILVNNASISEGNGILEIDEMMWDRVLAADLKGPFLIAKRVLPGMIAARQGVIVNITSVNGQAYFGEEAYSAAKAGLISLTQSIAVRHGKDGVRCVAIAPGTIRTAAWEDFLKRRPDLFNELQAWYPLGRVGIPDDVVQTLLFLSSEAASWITGTVVNVDGGLMAGNEAMATALQA